MNPSTTNPAGLPGIEELKRLAKSLAMLDAILSSDWDSRYYSYNRKWSPDEEMASMRNGCGDEWFLLFNLVGAAIKGFAHETPLARDGSFAQQIREQVSPEFGSFLNEPAFSMNQATFCLWRRATDKAWSVVSPSNAGEDGSSELIHLFDGKPASYQAWAESYYELSIDTEAVKAIYFHAPLTYELVAALNPELKLDELGKDVSEIGYPI
jgi:hypothetical protein